MTNDEIKETVKRRFANKDLVGWLDSGIKIYPISVGDFFPYPPKISLYENLALSFPINLEEFYNSIQEEYTYNCQFILDNFDRFFDIFADMDKIIGLGDVKCEDLLKLSLKTFSQYNDIAKKLLETINEKI